MGKGENQLHMLSFDPHVCKFVYAHTHMCKKKKEPETVNSMPEIT